MDSIMDGDLGGSRGGRDGFKGGDRAVVERGADPSSVIIRIEAGRYRGNFEKIGDRGIVMPTECSGWESAKQEGGLK